MARILSCKIPNKKKKYQKNTQAYKMDNQKINIEFIT